MHQQWRHKLDYVITLLGYSVGSGTFIKFPFYCMRNGGGAFLIPYLLFTVICAIPCVFLEMVIGQYSQSGPVKVWNLCPPFKGIGVGALIFSGLYYSYYNVYFGWFVYYFYHSFSTKLPWTHCHNTWNTLDCVSYLSTDNTSSVDSSNVTVDNVTSVVLDVDRRTAAEEFWRLHVLNISNGLEHLGSIQWPLAGCLVVTNAILFLWVVQGIKVSGKLVYITVIIPYILIAVFLIQGCLLPGSLQGMYYYIYPNFEMLLEPRVWIEACGYALFSVGVSTGCIITMSGHNKKHNNCLRDAVVCSLVDALSGVFIGFAFFSIIGHVAHLRGVEVDAFASSGFNLAFIVYPEVLAYLPLPQLWSVLTFLTLMSLAVDTMVPGIDIIIASLEDQFPRWTKRRWLTILAVLLIMFLFGFLYITQGGLYVITLVDWFAYFPALALYALLECIGVGWCYGIRKLQEDVRTMWGKNTPPIISAAIKYVCPLLIMVIFGHSVYSYRPPKYGTYIFPAWANVVGWMISLVSVLPFPIIFIWTVVTTSGSSLKEKLSIALEPNDQWRRATPDENMTEVLQSMI
ncbi:sodium- and chloride-dependent glycine transporter 1-like [Haliotis rubra]|uniref:sodium- and chloride-dependent glycine transporter 1-like n=1 Tax=Haliotis rubra TaxID=36100 RepID=UPI001EE57577|nr:sodium- and chloride-dependent glycine transporter 1-like [Haliotis rubra]